MVKSGQLTNIVDSVSTTNQQNLSTVKNVDLRKSHPHQQNWSIVQIVDSSLDPNQQSVSLKIGETTKCTSGFHLHNNKFVDQQSGSNVQIVVSGPTSTNCVIPNLPRGSRQLYQNSFDDIHGGHRQQNFSLLSSSIYGEEIPNVYFLVKKHKFSDKTEKMILDKKIICSSSINSSGSDSSRHCSGCSS